jgi:hypothetical protein
LALPVLIRVSAAAAVREFCRSRPLIGQSPVEAAVAEGR